VKLQVALGVAALSAVKAVLPAVLAGHVVVEVQTARAKTNPLPDPAMNPAGVVHVSPTVGGVDGVGTWP
jgi:hypothetical protein